MTPPSRPLPPPEIWRALLHAGLDQLVTPRQREALLLYYGEGMNLRQTAQQLGLSPSATSRRLSAGRRRLHPLALMWQQMQL